MKKKRKYSLGGNIGMTAFDMGANALSQLTMKSVTDMFSALQNPEREQRMVKSNTQVPLMQNGGKVQGNVELEGKELIETPNGEMGQVEGPSHEEGGVDMQLPEGTKVYSDRLKKEGEKMSQRKLKREKQLAKLEKILFESKDTLRNKSINRTISAIQKEEEADMQLQQQMNDMHNNMQMMFGGKMEYLTGGTVDPPEDQLLQGLYS